jgi:hypothetical protein
MAIDPALSLLEMIEEGLLSIIGGRQVWYAITSEQTPGAIADGFDQMLGDLRIIGVISCFALQASQEVVDFALNLSGLPPLAILFLDAQQVG